MYLESWDCKYCLYEINVLLLKETLFEGCTLSAVHVRCVHGTCREKKAAATAAAVSILFTK